MTQGDRPRDRGLQAERTALAWNRTGLALAANALLALRAGTVGQRNLTVLLGAALLFAAAVVVVYGARRKTRLTSGDVGSASDLALVLTVVVAWMACAVGLTSLLRR